MFKPLILALVITLVSLGTLFSFAKGNSPPAISITAPANGATYTAPASISITANATDKDGKIKKVEFFASGSMIGSVTVAPYTFVWSKVSPGAYSLTARATDDANAKTTSTAINVSVTGDPKSISGQWSPLIDFPNPAGCSGCAFLPIHMNLLPNGTVLMWQDDDASGPRGSGANTVAYVWDVTANTFTPADNSMVDVFCGGHAFLPDGKLLVAGGHNGSDNVGTTTTNLFDFNSNSWTLSTFTMNQGRWYPTVTTLGNGELAVVSGQIDTVLKLNTIPEVWQTNAGGGWRQLTSAALSQALYPWMFLAPNGQVFHAGPDFATRYLDTTGTGTWTWVRAHVYGNVRDYGSAVMYDPGKVLVMGGDDPPTNTVESIDLNAATPIWQSVAPMAYARRQMNATLLPDGKVMVTGGSSSGGFNDASLAVLPAEIWDPATGSWSAMASMQVLRMYHSVALLLPDGRVVTAGGGRPPATNASDQPNAQIYSPPYLFKPDGTPANRPVITSVPTSLAYGQPFFVSTPSTNINQVNLLRLGSVTHSFDQNQRISRLSFTATTGGLNAVGPANGNVCPPGHYMLFILSNGVPSVAKIVEIH